MRVRRSLAVTGLGLLTLLLCSSSAALAARTMPKGQRAAYARAIGRFARVLASTTTAQVIAQMAAAERRIDPCTAELEQIYHHGGPTSATIDWLLGAGVHDTAEQWYVNAALPIDRVTEQRAYVAEVRSTTRVDLCGVIAKWRAERYAQAKRPPIAQLLMEYIGPSPVTSFGARPSARTYRQWGFAHSTATHLAAELNRGLARYAALNLRAYTQYLAWLQLQGIYRFMRPADRQIVAFSRY